MPAPAPQNCGLVSESPCPGDLVKPRAGEPRGYCPSLPRRWGCYSGRRAQGPGMCSNRNLPVPVPGVRGPAASPPTRRSRPREGPLSQSQPPSLILPSRSAYSGTRTPEFRPKSSHSRSRPPQVQGSQRTGETLSPRVCAGEAGSPFPAVTFPGAAVTRGRTLLRLPPSLPGPRTARGGSGARPRSRGPNSAWPWPHPLRPQFPHRARGPPRPFQLDFSSLRGLVRSALL